MRQPVELFPLLVDVIQHLLVGRVDQGQSPPPSPVTPLDQDKNNTHSRAMLWDGSATRAFV